MMEMDLLFLFLARSADMCLGTMRSLLAVRGKRAFAALAAFGEVLIYLIALRLILTAEMGWLRMGVFAAGYATGVFLGTLVDERLALGTRLIQVVIDAPNEALVTRLRKRFPATVWQAEGRDGPKLVIQLHVPRRSHARVLRKIQRVAPKAFVLQVEPKGYVGGLMMAA
jgi:uncharacterized protein YebE (UPF0316 family)